MKPTILFALGGVLLVACGGKTDGTGTDTDSGTSSHDGSSSGSDAASNGDSPIVVLDAATTRDAGTLVVCQQGPSGGSGGSVDCEISVTETCSDGTTYQADCLCPSGTCSCMQMSGMSGSGGGGIPFSGCPTCPSPSAAFTACGFPQ